MIIQVQLIKGILKYLALMQLISQMLSSYDLKYVAFIHTVSKEIAAFVLSYFSVYLIMNCKTI